LFAKKLALALATAAIASVGVTGVAQGATVGQTCQVNPNSSGWYITTSFWWGNPGTSGGTGYTVYYPDSVIIDAVYDDGKAKWAHKSGMASGWINPDAINESTCH